jgi:hypothetical protein
MLEEKKHRPIMPKGLAPKNFAHARPVIEIHGTRAATNFHLWRSGSGARALQRLEQSRLVVEVPMRRTRNLILLAAAAAMMIAGPANAAPSGDDHSYLPPQAATMAQDKSRIGETAPQATAKRAHKMRGHAAYRNRTSRRYYTERDDDSPIPGIFLQLFD